VVEIVCAIVSDIYSICDVIVKAQYFLLTLIAEVRVIYLLFTQASKLASKEIYDLPMRCDAMRNEKCNVCMVVPAFVFVAMTHDNTWALHLNQEGWSLYLDRTKSPARRVV